MQKFVLVFIITFIKIGPREKIAQNNLFFCLLLCIFSYIAQTKIKPFVTPELNILSLKCSITIIFSMFLSFFLSFCQNYIMEIFIMMFFGLNNLFFLASVLKCYLEISLVFQKSLCFGFFQKLFSKFLGSG